MKSQVNEAIASFLENAQDMEITTTLCKCGSLQMSAFETSESLNFLASNAPYIKPTFSGVNNNCNRCANDWGVDKINNDQLIEELQEELNELEDLDRVTVSETGRISWLTEEIERLEIEAQES